jgi:hypothetical protein
LNIPIITEEEFEQYLQAHLVWHNKKFLV